MIHQRLSHTFKKFRDEGNFIDCILATTEGEIKCHKIFLSQQSTWFRQYFLDHPMKPRSVLTIQVEVNPKGQLKHFIDMLYNEKFQFEEDNLSSLLKIAVFYGFKDARTIFEDALKESIRDDNVLKLSKELIQLGLEETSCLLCSFLAERLEYIFQNGAKSKTSLRQSDIMESICPRMFAEIINNPVFSADLHMKLEMADYFNGIHKITELRDCKALSTIANWTEEDSYYLLVQHKCDWLPPNIARPLYDKLLNRRREIYTNLKDDFAKATDVVSRWYAMMWINTIKESKPFTERPVISLVPFITTIGGAIDSMGQMAQSLGLASFKITGEQQPGTTPLEILYHPTNLFNPSLRRYFRIDTQKTGFGTVYLALDKNSYFMPISASVSFRVNKREDQLFPQPKTVRIFTADNEDSIDDAELLNIDPIILADLEYDLSKSFTNATTASCFGLQMEGENKKQGTLMHVYSIDFTGSFYPCSQ